MHFLDCVLQNLIFLFEFLNLAVPFLHFVVTLLQLILQNSLLTVQLFDLQFEIFEFVVFSTQLIFRQLA